MQEFLIPSSPSVCERGCCHSHNMLSTRTTKSPPPSPSPSPLLLFSHRAIQFSCFSFASRAAVHDWKSHQSARPPATHKRQQRLLLKQVSRPPAAAASSSSSSSDGVHQSSAAAGSSSSSVHQSSAPSNFNMTAFLDGVHKTVNKSGELILLTFWLTTVWVRINTELGYSMEVWGVAGAILNHVLSKWLKRIIKQPRPSRVINNISPQYVDPKNLGMPSSHAQSLAFLASYSFLGGFVATLSWNVGTCCKFGLLMLPLGYTAWLRVREGYHTTVQVLVGGSVGALFAALWFFCYEMTFMWKP